jgi:hypothetical protein
MRIQTYNLPRARIEFAQTRVGLFRYNRVGVVALETHPRDIRIGIIVSVDSHKLARAYGELRAVPPPDTAVPPLLPVARRACR